MPLYKYACADCSLKFEEIVSFDKSQEVKCPECGGTSIRQFPDSISVKSSIDPKRDTIVSPKEIDLVVGADADKKREIMEKRKSDREGQEFGFNEKYHSAYKKRQDKRRKGLEPKEIEIPQDTDGKYSPLKHLGGSKERETREKFSEALTDHRAERIDDGKDQFDEKGSFE